MTDQPAYYFADGKIWRRGIYTEPDLAERLLARFEADPALSPVAEQLRTALHQAANHDHERDAA